MIKWFGDKKDSEQEARTAIQQRKWSRAIAYYEKKVRGERDLATWNLLGDLYMNNQAREQAVDAWRRALQGYAADGLHENVLGIARKILRRVPDEDDVHLLLAESCMEMAYFADCLAAMRNYIRSARKISEAELRAMFKKVLTSNMHHPHLLDELHELYESSKVEDIELSRQLDEFILRQKSYAASETPEPAEAVQVEEIAETPWQPAPPKHVDDGLQLLDVQPDDGDQPILHAPSFGSDSRQEAPSVPDYSSNYDGLEHEDGPTLAPGDGKDHYDLGNVYREMKLWDAALAEFEQARRDPTLRIRATLALAECLQETSNLQGALDLLESESRTKTASPQEQLNLHFQLGVVNELLGNLDDALKHYQSVYSQNSQHAEAEERIQSLRRKMGAAA